MKPILAVYATREGHTRRIAEYLAARIEVRGILANVLDAAQVPTGFSLENYSAAIVCASVHRGRHEPEMVKFVKCNASGLDRIPAAFLSVSLSQAGAEDTAAPAERRVQADADAKKMIQMFLDETGWRPIITKPVAGALKYTKYNWLLRFVMKRIAQRAGGATDTSRDYDYTGWEALDRVVDELLSVLSRGCARGDGACCSEKSQSGH